MKYQRLLIIVAGLATVLSARAVVADGRIGDWNYRAEGESGGRIAYTVAAGEAGAMPNLVIRRSKPGKAVQLLLFDTHDPATDKCEYKDWQIAVDATNVPVLGYTFKPAKTELKVKWGTSVDDFWNMFVKGFNFSVAVNQICESNPGQPSPVKLDFSLRGSAAVYKYVTSDASQ